jgi:hypothetical protein
MKRALLAAGTAALMFVCVGTASAGLTVSALGSFSGAHPAPSSNPQALYCGFGQPTSCAAFGFPSPDPNASRVLWGIPLSGLLSDKSGLTWLGASNLAAAFETPFVLGTLTHSNNTINGNTSIDAVTLTYDLALDDSGSSLFSSNVPVTLNVEDTPNQEPCPYPSTVPCSDRITWSVPASASVIPANASGGPYVLNILGFRTAPASPIVSEFISQEGSDNKASLFASIDRAGAGRAKDDGYSTVVDEQLVQAAPSGLLANDLDAGQASLQSQAAHGTAAVAADGSFTYQPDPGYIGLDSFVYLVHYGDDQLALATAHIVVMPDTTRPVLTVVDPTIVAEATSSAGAPVSFALPTATDPDDAAGPVTCDRVSGSSFQLGSTTVTCASTDTHGTTGTATITISVVDTTKPVWTVPADITAEATSPAGAPVSFAAPSSFDFYPVSTSC